MKLPMGSLMFALVIHQAAAHAQASAQPQPASQAPPPGQAQPADPSAAGAPLQQPAASADAQAQVDPTSHRHVGLFVRPDLGLGYLRASESVTGLSATVTGLAGVAGVALGAAIVENFVLAAHVFDAYTPSPSVSANGTSVPSPNSSVTLWGIGPEATYYIQPANLYVSGTVGITKMSISTNNVSASTDWGFGFRTAVGKEWWATDHWGLGVAANITFSTNPDPAANGTKPTLSTWTFGAAFSATYN